MEPLISIVIPAYNLETYIPKTLDSVLAQTYRNLQIIVVNDGSGDGTGRVLDEYAQKDCRIQVIHKENGGVTSARLRGIAEAEGQYIGFVDGDDYIEPQMYARLLENMLRYEADISHCGYQMVFPSGKVNYFYNTGDLVISNNDQGCEELLRGERIEPGLCNKLFRRELFQGLSQWMDLSIRNNEDLLMNFYLFRKAQISVFEDVCPYHYMLRRGSASTSGINEHKLKDPSRVQHILYEETLGNPRWNNVVQHRLVYQLIYNACISLGTQKELIKPFRKQAQKELRQKIGKILTGKFCGIKLKVMALWVAIWPASYRWVHSLYAKLTGIDKKYAVE